MDINLFNKLANKLAESETIADEDKELYAYGLRQAAGTIANVATTLIIGFIFGMVWQSILFMGAYIPLRSYAGGYHARTPLRCYIFSVILTVCILLSIKYIPYNNILILALTFVSGVVIFIFAPFGDDNKPLDEMETKVFRKRTRIILLAEISLIGLLTFMGLNFIAVCLSISVVCAGLMILTAIPFKGQRNS